MTSPSTMMAPGQTRGVQSARAVGRSRRVPIPHNRVRIPRLVGPPRHGIINQDLRPTDWCCLVTIRQPDKHKASRRLTPLTNPGAIMDHSGPGSIRLTSRRVDFPPRLMAHGSIQSGVMNSPCGLLIRPSLSIRGQSGMGGGQDRRPLLTAHSDLSTQSPIEGSMWHSLSTASSSLRGAQRDDAQSH